MNERRVGRKFPLRLKNGHLKAPILGPVANLEDHVNPDWWRFIFDSLYLKTDADVVDDHNITRDEVEYFLNVVSLGHEARILDMCCGQGRHVLEMARRGFANVEGLDRSRYLIQKARAQAALDRLNIKFREGDARKPHYPADTFDCVMILGNSFGYFERDLDDLHLLKEVFKILVPGGRCLLDVADGDYLRRQFESRSWEWLGKKHFVCRERSLSADGRRLISREVVTNVCKGVIADRFYAERLYSKEGIVNLLKQAGFHDCAVHGEISPNSVRNQDLGMMKQRVIVSARVEKVCPPIRIDRGSRDRNIAVVL